MIASQNEKANKTDAPNKPSPLGKVAPQATDEVTMQTLFHQEQATKKPPHT